MQIIQKLVGYTGIINCPQRDLERVWTRIRVKGMTSRITILFSSWEATSIREADIGNKATD